MKYFVLLYFVLINFTYAETQTVKLGDIKVDIIKYSGLGKSFVHLHENETTALAAAKHYLKQEGGTLITLKHSGQRNILFNLQGIRYEFDPNRIFTDQGIKKTLKQYGPYSAAAHQEVKKLATKIINLLPPGRVISVHNNQSYSLKEYFPQHALASEAKDLFYLPATNYRNFYFVTQQKDFNRLKALKLNVALQANKAQDDGSLSYFFADKSYINIEAAHGELIRQVEMLRQA